MPPSDTEVARRGTVKHEIKKIDHGPIPQWVGAELWKGGCCGHSGHAPNALPGNCSG